MLTVDFSGTAEIMKMGSGPPTSFYIKAFWTHLSAYIGEKAFAFNLCVGWVACILLSWWCMEGKTVCSHQTQLLFMDARGGEHSVQGAQSPSYKIPTLLQKHILRKGSSQSWMTGSRIALWRNITLKQGNHRDPISDILGGGNLGWWTWGDLSWP